MDWPDGAKTRPFVRVLRLSALLLATPLAEAADVEVHENMLTRRATLQVMAAAPGPFPPDVFPAPLGVPDMAPIPAVCPIVGPLCDADTAHGVMAAAALAATVLIIRTARLRRQLGNLRVAKEQAESARHAKDMFLATASHEIRTLLNAVSGLLELSLGKRNERGNDDEPLRAAHDSAQALLALTTDLLDLEKSAAGQLPLRPQPCDLRALTASVARPFDAAARRKGLQLRLNLDAAPAGEVLLDPARYRQILTNLLSNAIKFTASGHVTVDLETRPMPARHLAVRLRVADTGVGIAVADQDRLFKPYMQAGDTTSASQGTGLGLCIARELAQRMNGSISLRSVAGDGAEFLFAFEVPLAPESAGAADAAPAPAAMARRPGGARAAKLQILVVDDNDAGRLLLGEQLQTLGHDVVATASGAVAWRAWRPGAYDLVVTDCNMPGMSGHALARRIRHAEAQQEANGGTRYRCVIWAYTADTRTEEARRCNDAGMDACIVKPVGLERLAALLRRQPPSRRARHPAWRHGLRFDPGVIETLTGGAPALMTRLLDEVSRSQQRDSAMLRDALARTDWNGVADTAHALTGAARMIGARALADAGMALEQRVRTGGTPPTLRAAARRVLAEQAALEQAVRAWADTPHHADDAGDAAGRPPARRRASRAAAPARFPVPGPNLP
jgi:signal transduction histidine kinase/HPt (histidine-containing phosphotransfer) domain-containing protein